MEVFAGVCLVIFGLMSLSGDPIALIMFVWALVLLI